MTKQSSWEKPTTPALLDSAPPGPPPSYTGSGSSATAEKLNPNNPYNQPDSGKRTSQELDDAKLAQKLQDEENARSGQADRGASDSYYSQSFTGGAVGNPQISGSNYNQAQPQQDDSGGQKRGLMGKLMGKFGGHSNPSQQQGYGPQSHPPQYGGQPAYGAGYGPAGQYGMPPQQGYGYGGPPPAGYGGGYGGYSQQAAPARQTGGLGAMGGAALGLGGGLVGGMLLENAIQDHDQNEYNQGYDQGYDQGDNQGYDQGMDQGDGGF